MGGCVWGVTGTDVCSKLACLLMVLTLETDTEEWNKRKG